MGDDDAPAVDPPSAPAAPSAPALPKPRPLDLDAMLRPRGGWRGIWIFAIVILVVSVGAIVLGLRNVKSGLAPVRATDAYLASAEKGTVAEVRSHLCPAVSAGIDDATLQARLDVQRSRAPKGRTLRVTGFGRPDRPGATVEVNYAYDLPKPPGGGPTTTSIYNAVVVHVVEVDGRWLACGTTGLDVPGAIAPP